MAKYQDLHLAITSALCRWHEAEHAAEDQVEDAEQHRGILREQPVRARASVFEAVDRASPQANRSGAARSREATPRISSSYNGRIARTIPVKSFSICSRYSRCIAIRFRTNSGASNPSSSRMTWLTTTPPTGIPKSV